MDIENDILVADMVYSDAKNIFKLPANTVDEIKKDCIVVLDTNVLILPFTVSSNSFTQISTVFEDLKKENRLYIPAQVAREFAKVRPRKLGDLYQKLSKQRNNIQPFKLGNYPLLESLDNFNSIVEAEAELNEKIKEYRKLIGGLLSDVKAWVWNDPVSIVYNKLFTDDLIIEPEIDKQKIQKELDYLIYHKLPPGYKDSSKQDRGVGDLLIWKSILKLGSENKNNLLFVSGDNKPDWWHQSEKQHLYPRYELVNEYRRESDNKLFHMVSLSQLLELMDVNEEIVENIKNQEEINRKEQSCNTLINLLLNDPNVSVRIQATVGLGSMGSVKAVPALCKALIDDPETSVRIQAAVALRKIGDDSAIPALSKAVEDDEESVRIQCTVSISSIMGVN